MITPSLGSVNIEWAFRFATIASNTNAQLFMFTSKHFRIDEARNRAVLEALKLNPTHVLFWDGDVIPFTYGPNQEPVLNPKVIEIMLNWRYPVVSAYYYTSKLLSNTFIYDEKECIYKPYEIPYERAIEFVDAVGLGFCLVDARIFRMIEPPWFEYKCEYEKTENGLKITEVSEDITFCDKLRKLGFKVMVLRRIFCKHIHNAYIVGKDKFELVRTR